MAAAANRLTYLNMQSAARTGELESLKVDRLRELQATIAALRCEQRSRDPLLDWVLAEAARPPGE